MDRVPRLSRLRRRQHHDLPDGPTARCAAGRTGVHARDMRVAYDGGGVVSVMRNLFISTTSSYLPTDANRVPDFTGGPDLGQATQLSCCSTRLRIVGLVWIAQGYRPLNAAIGGVYVMRATVMYEAGDVRVERCPGRPVDRRRRTRSFASRAPRSAAAICGRTSRCRTTTPAGGWATSSSASSRRSAPTSRRSRSAIWSSRRFSGRTEPVSSAGEGLHELVSAWRQVRLGRCRRRPGRSGACPAGGRDARRAAGRRRRRSACRRCSRSPT